MSQTALVGLGASGNDTTDLATAMLDNVSVQQILPTVNVVATGSAAYKQGPAAGQYTITRNGDSMYWPLTVYYTMGGGAAAGTDYVALTGSAVIPAGAASTTVTLTPIYGGAPDGTPTATLTLASNAAYTTGSTSSANILIYDTPFNYWRLANFSQAQLNNASVSGPTATPANDGIPVLMKYALNLAPLAVGQAGLPVLTASNGTLSLTYARPNSATDITYIPEVSPDLVNWYSGPGYVSVTSVAASGSTQRVTATSLLYMSTNPMLFMKLEVTKP
jgi:hypothetical protein